MPRRRRRRRGAHPRTRRLTLRYLWLARVDNQAERVDRLRRLQLNWVRGRAIYGEELDYLGYVPDDDAEAEQHRQNVAQFRARADELERERVGSLPDDRATAIRLDRDLQPDQPRFFELLYARIYRPTSDVAHYGIGAALAGFIADPDRPDALTLEYIDEDRAAEALGLGLVTFAVLLDFSEPIIRLGITDEVAQLIQDSGLRA